MEKISCCYSKYRDASTRFSCTKFLNIYRLSIKKGVNIVLGKIIKIGGAAKTFAPIKAPSTIHKNTKKKYKHYLIKPKNSFDKLDKAIQLNNFDWNICSKELLRQPLPFNSVLGISKGNTFKGNF